MAKEELNDGGFMTTNLDVYGEEEPWKIYKQGVPTGGPEDNDEYSYSYFITKKTRVKTMELGNNKVKKNLFLDMRNPSIPFIMAVKKKMHHVHTFGHWIMKEYELSPLLTCWLDEDRTDYAVCAIKREHIHDCTFQETSTTTTTTR